MIYVNNAGSSWPRPPEVGVAVTEALQAGPDRAAERLTEARDTVCDFLGIVDRDRFLFTTGCTSGLAVALADLPWQAGDVVLTSSLEHHALTRPVEQLRRAHGVEHVAVPYRPGNPCDVDFALDVLRRGKVRLVAFSAASNVTGELLPSAALADLAREHGALCLLDAAQTVGVSTVDVGALGVDLLAFAGHKGPLGPSGIGGLWAAPHVEFESPQAQCEVVPGDLGPRPCASFPGYCDVGSVNLPGAAGLAAGLRWLTERGDAGSRARELARRLIAGLAERDGCRVIGATDAERTATVSLAIERLPVARAESFLAARGIIARAGQHCAPLALRAIGERAGTIRVSFGPFNGDDDVDAVLAAVDEARRA